MEELDDNPSVEEIKALRKKIEQKYVIIDPDNPEYCYMTIYNSVKPFREPKDEPRYSYYYWPIRWGINGHREGFVIHTNKQMDLKEIKEYILQTDTEMAIAEDVIMTKRKKLFNKIKQWFKPKEELPQHKQLKFSLLLKRWFNN